MGVEAFRLVRAKETGLGAKRGTREKLVARAEVTPVWTQHDAARGTAAQARIAVAPPGVSVAQPKLLRGIGGAVSCQWLWREADGNRGLRLGTRARAHMHTCTQIAPSHVGRDLRLRRHARHGAVHCEGGTV